MSTFMHIVVISFNLNELEMSPILVTHQIVISHEQAETEHIPCVEITLTNLFSESDATIDSNIQTPDLLVKRCTHSHYITPF